MGCLDVSVKRPSLGFGSGHSLRIVETGPQVWCHLLSEECACPSPSPSVPTLTAHGCSLSKIKSLERNSSINLFPALIVYQNHVCT